MTHFFLEVQFDFRSPQYPIVGRVGPQMDQNSSSTQISTHLTQMNPIYRSDWVGLAYLGSKIRVEYIPWAVVDQIEVEYES